MKLSTLHNESKGLSAVAVFKNSNCVVTSIQILTNHTLKEHITKQAALLLCVDGHVKFEDENGIVINMVSGDYYHIQPMLKHWLIALEDSQLLLFK